MGKFVVLVDLVSIILETPSFPDITSMCSSRTTSWASPSRVKTITGPCSSELSDADLSQMGSSFIQSSYVLLFDNNGGDLFKLYIVKQVVRISVGRLFGF